MNLTDAEEQNIVEREYDALLSTLRRLRKLFAFREYRTLDLELGSSGGAFSDALDNRIGLPLHRLVAFSVTRLSSLAPSLSKSLLGLRHPRFPPSPPDDVLNRLFRREWGPCIDLRLRDLHQWAKTLPAATVVKVPTRSELRSLRSEDPEAEDLLSELFDALSSRAGTEPCVNRENYALDVAWAAGVYAGALRNAGSYGLAAGYLDFAFALERRYDCFETRAFLFRCSAYLCIEVEMLDMGEVFASNALHLCQATENVGSLCRSLLLMAQIAFWRRDFDDAERFLLGATTHSVYASQGSSSSITSRTSSLERALALERLWIALAKGDLERAESVYQAKVSSLLDDPATPEHDRGKLHLGAAVLHSYCNDVGAADTAFRNARALIDDVAHPSDQAALALWEGRHRLRHKTSILSNQLAEVIMIADRLASPRASRILDTTAEKYVEGTLDAAALTNLAWSFMGLRQPDEAAA